MIFDRQYSPLMLVHEGAQYVPAESVYGVFEVRPSLTPATLQYAGQKVRSVRSLKRTSARVPDVTGAIRRKKLYRILGGILTLNTSIRTEAELRQAAGDRNIGLDLGCSLEGRSFVVEPAVGRRRGGQILVSDRSESLIFFFLKLLEHLQRLGTAPAIDLPSYGASLHSL